MKLLFDFLPIVLFFVAYKLADIYVATGALIVATLGQVAWSWLKHRRVGKMLLVTAVLVVAFGGATLIFHDPVFVKWKPTVVNWLFAAVFIGSCFIGQKTVIERLMSDQLELPRPVWVKLTFAWASFFLIMGLTNLYIAFTFSESAWVNFKTIGILGLTLLFVSAQWIYISRYLKSDDAPSKES